MAEFKAAFEAAFEARLARASPEERALVARGFDFTDFWNMFNKRLSIGCFFALLDLKLVRILFDCNLFALLSGISLVMSPNLQINYDAAVAFRNTLPGVCGVSCLNTIREYGNVVNPRCGDEFIIDIAPVLDRHQAEISPTVSTFLQPIGTRFTSTDITSLALAALDIGCQRPPSAQDWCVFDMVRTVGPVLSGIGGSGAEGALSSALSVLTDPGFLCTMCTISIVRALDRAVYTSRVIGSYKPYIDLIVGFTMAVCDPNGGPKANSTYAMPTLPGGTTRPLGMNSTTPAGGRGNTSIPVLSAGTGTSACRNGFAGPDCNICVTDAGCAGADPARGVCGKGSAVVAGQSNGICLVEEPMLTTLFPGDRITASLARSLPGSAASASVFYGQQLNFRCSFSSCSRQLAVSADVWTCQTAACSCIRGTMMCGDPSVLVDLTGALEHVHGPFALECPFGPDGNGTECTFVVEQLRGILPRGLKLTNCAHGECVASASAHQELVSAAAAAPPSSSATSPPPSSGGPSTIAIGIGGAIVGSAFIALTGMFAWAKSVQLQLAKLPVGNVGTPGVDVGFKGVGYTIGGPAAPLPGGAPATSVTPPAGGPAVSVVSGVTAPGAPLAAPGATVGLPTLIGVPAGAIPPVAPPVQPRARTDTDDTDVSDADGPENQDQTTSNRDRKSEKEKKNKKRRRRDDEGTPCRCCSLPKLRRKKNKKKPKVVLQGVDFQCLSGRVTAIMGPSGSGKSSLLDIVAGRSKEGSVAGTAALEGAEVRREDLRRLVSFVDQEDHFLPYMTVRECVAFSARCRLPEAFPAREREARVEAVLRTLGLEHVADTRVGGRGVRGVSGGERRRVSIACELVTGSGVLVLDEPTSGLDAHTAASLLRTLKDLALAEGKTVVLSIHQPSSESFKLIDDLVVLAKGRVIYSGEAKAAKSYFGALGHICPQDYNVADFLLDLAVEHGDAQAQEATVRCLAPTVHKKDRSETRYSVEGHAQLPVFGTSGIAPASGSNEQGSHGLRKPAGNRTSGLTRFGAVMSRSLRSLFRDPSLMAAHFLIAVFLGVLVGGLYFRSPSTIGGLQNKLGGIVFILALLAFSSLSALGIFAGERLLFVRERSASYYGPASFAGSKLVLDLVPLRILPALIVGSISYWMIGLVPAAGNFLRFLLVLVLFNCAAALICMVVAAGIENQGTANLLASIVMLFSLLFGGFLINLANIPAALSWIQYLSIFRYATEALAVNEAAGAQVSDNLGGIPISIPASTVLTKLFGFNVDAFWTDAVALMVWVAGLAGLFFVLVRWRLVERR